MTDRQAGLFTFFSIIGLLMFIFLVVYLVPFGPRAVAVMVTGQLFFISLILFGVYKITSLRRKYMSAELEQRTAAVPAWQLFHSYTRPTVWFVTGIALLLLYYLISFLWSRNESPYIDFISYGGAFALIALGMHRRGRLQRIWPTIRTFAEHAGWKVNGKVDSKDLIPLHLAPPPRVNNATISSEVHVMTGSGDEHSMFLVVEEFFAHSKGWLLTRNLIGVLCYVSIRLPGTVYGWVRLLPEERMFFKALPDHDVEFHDFNKKFFIHSEPAKLRTQVLSPDLMDWYFRLPIRLWLHVEGNIACLSAGWNPTYLQLQQLFEAGAQISPYIERSGALEREHTRA